MLADLAASQACQQQFKVALAPNPTDVKAHIALPQHV